MIPLGILATTAGGAAPAYELISTTVLGGTQASIAFSSIPSTYKHLQIRVVGRLATVTNNQMQIRFNGDTAANYSWHSLTGSDTSVASTDSTSQTAISAGVVGYNANIFSGSVIEVLDYASTSKNKTVRSLHGVNDGIVRVGLHSGLWLSTSAISSISISDNNASFAAGSRFSLYGIKG